MRLIFTMMFSLFIGNTYAQNLKSENIGKQQIEFIKSKKVSKTFNSRANTLIMDKTAKRVMVRCKIVPSNNQIDINSFSLIDSKNKLRYRLSDISAYYFYGAPKIHRYWKEKPFDKKGKEVEVFFAEYNPSIEDTFLKYPFNDYKICESKFSFSSGQRIANYYGPVECDRKFTADLYFVVEKDFLKQSGYALYFRNQKIADVDF